MLTPSTLRIPVLAFSVVALAQLGQHGPTAAAQASPPTTSGHADGVRLNRLRGDKGIEHVVTGAVADEDSMSPDHPTKQSRRSDARSRVHYASFPQLGTQPDGSRCIRVVRRAFASAAAAATAEDTQDALWRISSRDYPLCERAVAAGTTPAAEAAMFWRVVGEDLLPKPSPRIAPGYMLAGKLAYLEAGTEPTARFDHDTPLGTLSIEASAKVFVDWGDGSRLDGPHDGPGAPWPDGDITHFWTTAGTYDVRVVQRWTARWQLGEASSGELVGLSTEAVIDDFEVRQLQAVRNN